MTLILIKLHLLTLTTLLTLAASALSPPQNPQHPFGPSQHQNERLNPRPKTPKIRNATEPDVPSIAKVFRDAFSPYPTWQYIHQFADQYPQYHQYCLLETTRRIIEQTTRDGQGVIKVISVPDEDGDGLAGKVVSFAFWQFVNETTIDSGNDVSNSDQQANKPSTSLWSNLTSISPSPNTDTTSNKDPDSPPFNCTLHLDLNLTRLTSILSQESTAIARYLTPTYPTRLYLALLATHPDYDGHGYAAAQVHLGLEWAVERGLPVTLLATPAGYPVYKGLGFREIQNVTVESLDRSVLDWEEVMVWEGGFEGRDGGRC